MAGPTSPFAVIQNQKDGVTGPAGRGRGGASMRPMPYQANVSSTLRDPNNRGRGRGAPRAGRGRGRGAGPAHNTWRKPEPNSVASGYTGNSNSPFNALKQNQSSLYSFSQPSSFGQPSAPMQPISGPPPVQSKPTVSSFGKPSQPLQLISGPGVVSGSLFSSRSKFDGASGDLGRDPRKCTPSMPSTGAAMNGNGTSVPVENASTLESYNDRYEQLKVARAKERERAIRDGQMADPNQPTNLNQAITPVGTCTSMCPEFERVERIVQKMVDKSEKFLHPATNKLQTMELKMLKRFRRSAAGYDEQLPSDIRTPGTLLQTMNYLMRHVLGGPEPLGVIHKFVWDRTRSIRNDLSVQQLTQEDHVRMAVTCLERIARFHIVSLHLLSSPANEEPFDHHQEREQLNNTMLSLMYYYDDNRGRISFANEDEFRAYYIVFSIHDQRPDLEARVQKWPAELRNSPQVQLALELLATAGNTWEYQGTLDSKRPNAIAQGFYTRFFSLVDSPATSYLLACVAEIYFSHLRQTAIRSIWKGYCRSPSSQQHKNEEWTVDELTKVLYFDDDGQTIKFCEEQDLQFAENANGDMYLNWGSRPVESVAFQPSSEHSFSQNFVEGKRGGRTLVAVVLGLAIKEASQLGMVDESALQQRSLAPPSTVEPVSDDDSLFVKDDGNVYPAPSMQSHRLFEKGPTPPDTPFSPDFQNHDSEIISNVADSAGDSTTSGSIGIFAGSQNTSQPSQTLETSLPGFSSPTGTPTGVFSALAPASLNPDAPTFSPSMFPPQSSTTSPGASAVTSTQPSKPSLFPSAPPIEHSKSSLFPSIPSKEPQQPSISSAAQPSDHHASVLAPTSGLEQAGSKNDSTASPFNLPSSTTAPAQTFSPFSSSNSPTSPFSPTGSSPSKPVSSVFDSVKIPTFGTFGSVLSQPGSSAVEPIIGAEESAQMTSTNTSSSVQTDSENDSSTEPVFQPTINSITAEQNPTESAKSDEDQEIQTHDQTDGGVEGQQSLQGTLAQPTSSHDNPLQALPPVPNEGSFPKSGVFVAPPTASTEPQVTLGSSPLSREQAANDRETTSPDATEDRDSWMESLKEAAEKRRKTSVGRKRPLNDHEDEAPLETGAKPSKVSKPAGPILRKKTSMALSSIKPLPTLPILERVKSMIAKKPAAEHKPEPPKPNQVDEDELLLSAARIAAESLRSGPKIWDGYSTSQDTRHSSFSPRNSYTSMPYSPRDSVSSVPFSRSLSPQSSVNGHGLALAPDGDLGLGRSLSRTEQRLRLTGGKGLAYKPLDFTPKKPRKSK